MNFIFFGFLLSIFGGFTINQVNIGPLLSVGAYFLIYKGVLTVDGENPFFKKIITLLFILMGLSGVAFLTGLVNLGPLGSLVGLAVFIIDIIVFYNVIKGIQLYADKLIDKTQPKKLFKRWRMQYILIGIIIVLSIVMFVVAITTVSWAAIAEMVQSYNGAGPLDQEAIRALLSNYMNVLQPVLVTLMIWIFGVLSLALALLVFKIMFLASMYRIQADYQIYLANPTSVENPTELQ